MQHRHCQRKPLTQAERQRVGMLIEIGRQSEARHQISHALIGQLLAEMEQTGMQPEILAHGQFAI